jgi:hypothetical protein
MAFDLKACRERYQKLCDSPVDSNSLALVNAMLLANELLESLEMIKTWCENAEDTDVILQIGDYLDAKWKHNT